MLAEHFSHQIQHHILHWFKWEHSQIILKMPRQLLFFHIARHEVVIKSGEMQEEIQHSPIISSCLTNSHWKMLTFMPSFHQSAWTRWFTEMHFAFHPTPACCSFICQECLGTKGPTQIGECWLKLALLLCPAPISHCWSSPQWASLTTGLLVGSAGPLSPSPAKVLNSLLETFSIVVVPGSMTWTKSWYNSLPWIIQKVWADDLCFFPNEINLYMF